MKIAYPLKRCPTDPRVVLDANLAVICTFLEGEHAEEMIERMNATELEEVKATARNAEFAIGKLRKRIGETMDALSKAEDIIDCYIEGIVL